MVAAVTASRGSVLVRHAVAAVPARCADGGSGVAVALFALGRGDPALAGLLVGALNLPHALAGPFVGRLDELAIYVTTKGFDFQVHEPPELVEHVRTLAARLAGATD